MIPVLYTNSDKIRAALGLSDIELLDDQIENLEVEDLLTLDLVSVYPDHAALQTTIQAGTATDEEKVIYMNLRQYAKYRGACFLLPQMQMIAARRITDGDFEQTRFGPDSLAEFAAGICAEADKYMAVLNPELGVFAFQLFSAVTPSYDPVTNEGA